MSCSSCMQSASVDTSSCTASWTGVTHTIRSVRPNDDLDRPTMSNAYLFFVIPSPNVFRHFLPRCPLGDYSFSPYSLHALIPILPANHMIIQNCLQLIILIVTKLIRYPMNASAGPASMPSPSLSESLSDKNAGKPSGSTPGSSSESLDSHKFGVVTSFVSEQA